MNRGRPSNYLLPTVENRDKDLKVMNEGKVGRPYQYSNVEIFAAFAIKCIFKLGYREASGIVEDYELQYGVDNTPNFRTIQWRIEKLRKDIISISIHEESKDRSCKKIISYNVLYAQGGQEISCLMKMRQMVGVGDILFYWNVWETNATIRNYASQNITRENVVMNSST